MKPFPTTDPARRMKNVNKSLKSVFLFSGKLNSFLSYLWGVYSAPSVVGQDVLTLIALCSAIAIATAGLLYYWLSANLRYDAYLSIKIASAYSMVLSLFLLLCHPLRCVGTMAMLSLFTKQGRKLIISTSFVILIFNVVPNITINIGAVVHILKCTSEGFAKNLLSSSTIFNLAKGAIVKETRIAIEKEFKSLKMDWITLDHVMHINMSEVKSRFTHISRQIERDFVHASDLVKDYKLLFNRILAALFIFVLILQSAQYLKSYLTSLQFESEYLAKESIEHHPESIDEKCLTKKRKMTGDYQSGLMSMALVTLYFIAMTFIIVLDHVVFQIVDMSLPWFLDIPSTPASITLDFKTWWFTPALCVIPSWCDKKVLTQLQRDYSWVFTTDPSLCHVQPSAPDVGVRVLLASLWLLSYFFVLLEVLARRMRRKVAASFFKKQEERRAAFWVKKLQAKRDQKPQQIFSVSVQCV